MPCRQHAESSQRVWRLHHSRGLTATLHSALFAQCLNPRARRVHLAVLSQRFPGVRLGFPPGRSDADPKRHVAMMTHWDAGRGHDLETACREVH